MKKELVVGLDVGSSIIKTVVAQITGNEKLPFQIIGVGKAPSRGIRQGTIIDMRDAEESIHSSLKNAENLTGATVEDVYLSVGGEHIDSSSSKGVVAVSRADGEISSEDVDRVINASKAINVPQNREILHVLPQQFSVDENEAIKNPVGMTGVRLGVDALVIQGMLPTIKTLAKVVESNGVNIRGVVVDALAASTSILNKKQKDLGVVLIDIGASTTSLIVYENGEIKHLRILPVGSGHVTNDIAIGLRTTIDVAEKVKIKYGIANPNEVDRKEQIDLSKLDPSEQGAVSRKEVALIIEARLEEIFRMVNNELDRIQRRALLPAGAILTGGGAKLRGIVDIAKNTLKLPIQIGFPAETGGIIEEVDDPAYATPIGLIVWQMEHGGLHPSKARIDLSGFSDNMQKVKGWLKNLLP